MRFACRLYCFLTLDDSRDEASNQASHQIEHRISMSWLCSLAELWGCRTSSPTLTHDELSRPRHWWVAAFLKFGWMSRDELKAEAARQREAGQELLRKSGEDMYLLREMMPFGADACEVAKQVRHHRSSTRHPHGRPPVRSEHLSSTW